MVFKKCLLREKGYVSDFHVDYLHSFISGHSGGSHVAVSQLQVRCRENNYKWNKNSDNFFLYAPQTNCLHYQGLILLDAVDGNNPIPENITMYVITPGQKVNFTIPTLQVVTGLDPVIGNGILKTKKVE